MGHEAPKVAVYQPEGRGRHLRSRAIEGRGGYKPGGSPDRQRYSRATQGPRRRALDLNARLRTRPSSEWREAERRAAAVNGVAEIVVLAFAILAIEFFFSWILQIWAGLR